MAGENSRKGPKLGKVDTALMSTLPMSLDRHDLMRLARGGTTDNPRISLLIYHRDGTHVVTLSEGQRVVLGRDAQADVLIRDASLSRMHARFEVVGGKAWVEDLGSTNGTQVNGAAVGRARLSVRDEATMGSVTASIHVLERMEARVYGLDGHDRFLTLLADEVLRAHTFGRTFGLLMLRVGGKGSAGVAILTPELRKRLRGVDRLALYSADTFEILLPEATREETRQVAASLLSASGGADGTGSSLVCGLAVFPECGTSADELLDVCRAALRKASAGAPIQLAEGAQARSRQGEPSVSKDTGLVVLSPVMRLLYKTVQRLASSRIPVLLIGETGSGKEVVARALHENGPRSAKRMASINCGAIPGTLVESVLFGHEKGAFTGASQRSKGLFEEADGGTVLLDEVGELSASAQAALLRVLEEKKLTRVGSNKEISVDVRVVAATHRDLEQMCEQGEFRSDLFYRLNAMMLKVPSLRERPEELSPLAEFFVEQAAAANGLKVSGIEPAAMRQIHRYPWPGNVRELRNAMERAVVVAYGDRVCLDDLPQRVAQTDDPSSPSIDDGSSRSVRHTVSVSIEAPGVPEDGTTDCAEGAEVGGREDLAWDPEDGGEAPDFRSSMQRYEAQLIVDALRRSSWNRTAAARALQMPVRTLSHKMRQHGIKKLGYALDDESE